MFKSEFLQFRGYFFIIIIALIVAEICWSYRTNKKVYNTSDTLANLGVFIGFNLTKVLTFSLHYSIYVLLSEIALFRMENKLVVFIITLFAVDFVYYWYHRISHKVKFLWAFHLIHHSSLFMNLTVAYRLNWLNVIITPIVLAPLILMGFPIEFVILSFAINLLYQFFMHTEAIGKLGFIENILITPSTHRVHHGSNKIYIDKNFGGILIVWDRVFGTYQTETVKPIYGTTKGFISNNPIRLNFQGFIDYFKGVFNYKG